jgi:hypothetical protein
MTLPVLPRPEEPFAMVRLSRPVVALAVLAAATLLGGAGVADAVPAPQALGAASCTFEKLASWTPTQARPTSGWEGRVTIRNTGTIPLVGWTANTTLRTGDAITASTGASATVHHGQAYDWDLAPEGNEIIAPGGTAAFRFTASVKAFTPSNGPGGVSFYAAGMSSSVYCTGIPSGQPQTQVPTARCTWLKTATLPTIPGTSWNGYTGTITLHNDFGWARPTWAMSLGATSINVRITAITGARKRTITRQGWTSYVIAPAGNATIPAHGSVSYAITVRTTATDADGFTMFADDVACGTVL